MKSILITLLFITNLCLAQDFNSGGPVSSNYYQELPYEEINGKIIIEVEITSGKHKFLLDTGAPFMLDTELAAQLGITSVTKGTIGDAYGNVNNLQYASVPSIKLGDIEFKNVPAMIGLAGFLKCLHVEGIAGSNLFCHSILQFVGSKKMIVLTDDENRLHLDKKNRLALATKIDKQSSPFIKVTVAPDISTQLLFDTGDDHFLSISDNYMDIFKSRHAFEILSTGYGANQMGQNGAEKEEARYRLRINALQAGTANFKNIVTETVHNNGTNGNRIGSRLLDFGTVTIDYLHSRFYFDPLTAENDLTETGWPISLMFSNEKVVVGVVWDKLRDQLKPGIQIIAIDDLACEKMDICTMFTHPLLQGKTHALLTLKEPDGSTQKLEITKE